MEQKLGRDVFIALAAVGWADGTLESDEADAIVQAAAEEGLEIEEIAEIEEATRKPVDIGEIDLSQLSKADRLFVYAIGAWIARVDGNVAPEEITVLNRLGDALKIPEKPRQHADAIAVEIGKRSESDKPGFFNLPRLRRVIKKELAKAKKLRQKAGE